MKLSTVAAVVLSLVSTAAAAQSMTVAVDATDVSRGVLHSALSVPVTAGPLTLLYPKWMPGEHGPTGPLLGLANIQIRANGERLSWHRDPLEMYALQLDVPAGTTAVDVTLDFLLPSGGNFSAGRTATSDLAVVSWNTVLLYPLGRSADDISVRATLRLPRSWKYATALTTERVEADRVQFATTSLARLIDSPVQTGIHQRVVKLRQVDGRAHDINLVSDTAAAIEPPTNFATVYNNLVDEAGLMFGGHHYGAYHWLLTLSNGVAHFGLEHHESSDDRVAEDALQTPAGQRGIAFLMAHEYVHSWNGKYRRPQGLMSPAYQTVMRSDLLWVYEGLTEYLSFILPARMGAWTAEETRERFAWYASGLESQTGRTWRPLLDTAVEAQVLYTSAGDWWSARRGTDFYEESVYVWLEADAIIRTESGGKRSLDDFLRRFYGGNTPPAVNPYTFDDVIAAMTETQPYDWRNFFESRLNSVEPHAPLGGLGRSGWKLVYTDVPNDAIRENDVFLKLYPMRESIGLELREGGVISDVTEGRAAAAAGLAPGFTIIAVDGRKFSDTVLRNAVKDSKTTTDPIQIIAQNGDVFSVHTLDYHGGIVYPHLVRDDSRADLFTAIIAPRRR
jgi:predicted metalloprotease with PDZ domain